MLMKGKKPRKFDYIPRLYKEEDQDVSKTKFFKSKKGKAGRNRGVSLYKIVFLIFLVLFLMYYFKNYT